jgi:hypothetical protein
MCSEIGGKTTELKAQHEALSQVLSFRDAVAVFEKGAECGSVGSLSARNADGAQRMSLPNTQHINRLWT